MDLASPILSAKPLTLSMNAGNRGHCAEYTRIPGYLQVSSGSGSGDMYRSNFRFDFQSCGPDFSSMKELPHTRSCFVCGEANPLGLNLRFETDGRVVRSQFKPRTEHAGFRHTVHGGLIATVLDEAMVWACAVQTRQFGFCAELNVRFVHPLNPGQSVIVVSELSANRRGRLFDAKSELQDDTGRVLASATGKYIPLKGIQISEMASDFVGNWQWILELGKPPST